ncbi:uncharacterized protein MELLADRAFT_66109 [Melampsora larici-populina 98AG31]|uniref:Uncharacterized protein n=1 Tax=Melampsora larici-populina (strain 98AG31 / pathotype 3-4-7) TaxID=747676 RepID=F4RXX1_MELLP|nr:uncharacterized protein MELLADRAFT_66109 [Melampsora larici-populina 98AG31]EGG02805.1 hypothetical protein MELLADRAFT_66109 [Melampsora larici-populina 98AG31]
MPYEPIGNLIHEHKDADEVFNPAYLIADGDDAPARHPTLERLWRQGTESRRLMEESQSFTIAVTFKIHTNNTVDVAPGMAKSKSSSKVTAAKKRAAPAPKFAVIDYSDFKDGQVLDFKVFLYGKSLNKLKDLVGNLCDQYFAGIKKVVLNSALTPLLNWNATVGLKKTKLIDFKGYQEFVTNLGKSRSSKGSINITLEKPQVKEKKNAQASGAMAYIQGTNGPNPIEAEFAASKEETVAAQEETLKVKQEPKSPSPSPAKRFLARTPSLREVGGQKKVKVEEATRSILRKANVTSWTDLVPSVQMTANVLTGHGMTFDLATRLLETAAEADAQYAKSPTPKQTLIRCTARAVQHLKNL